MAMGRELERYTFVVDGEEYAMYTGKRPRVGEEYLLDGLIIEVVMIDGHRMVVRRK